MLDRLKEGLRDELASLFDDHTEGLKIATFIVSLSEHDDDEDQLGRLSMWRAYGGKTGVALVLNSTAFVAETDEMNVFSSPVFYQDVPAFVKWFEGWGRNIIDAEDKLRQLDTEATDNWLFTVFRTFALCTKHPGFSEEKEWRVFHSPILDGPSDWIQSSIEIINGTPQHLMKLTLKDDTNRNIVGVAPATLINRVIIGTCEYPIQVRAAIVAAMTDVGVDKPMDKMWMSLIPYKHP